MCAATNTAGLVGRFGETSFMSLSSSRQDPRVPPKYPKVSKFFKSRNLMDVENIIEENDEEVVEDQETTEKLNDLEEDQFEEPSSPSQTR